VSNTISTAPEVLKGIQSVMHAFSEKGIGKNSKNESQGFKFRGIDEVLNRMSQHLTEAGLVIIPQMMSRDVSERQNSRGNPLFYVTVTMAYTIRSVIDGSEVVCVVPGEAMDSGDKATNKALSIAYKYMAFQLFAIPIDEDPDKTTHELMPKAKAKVEMLNDDDVSIIKELVDKAGEDEDTILNAFKVITWQEIPRDKFAVIVSKLQKKISLQNEGVK